MDRLRNAFELPQAYVPHRRVAAGPHQRAHRIGHEVSSGFGLLGEARGEDHRRADVRPVVLHRFAGVDADADPERKVRVALVVGLGPPRDPEGATDRVAGRGEDEIEAVALGLDLHAALRANLRAHDRPESSNETRGGGITMRLDEHGVVAEIGEEIGANGSSWHGRYCLDREKP